MKRYAEMIVGRSARSAELIVEMPATTATSCSTSWPRASECWNRAGRQYRQSRVAKASDSGGILRKAGRRLRPREAGRLVAGGTSWPGADVNDFVRGIRSCSNPRRRDREFPPVEPHPRNQFDTIYRALRLFSFLTAERICSAWLTLFDVEEVRHTGAHCGFRPQRGTVVFRQGASESMRERERSMGLDA